LFLYLKSFVVVLTTPALKWLSIGPSFPTSNIAACNRFDRKSNSVLWLLKGQRGSDRDTCQVTYSQNGCREDNWVTHDKSIQIIVGRGVIVEKAEEDAWRCAKMRMKYDSVDRIGRCGTIFYCVVQSLRLCPALPLFDEYNITGVAQLC
jgi:hypothetical protein